jgi:ribosomal protein S18 acetylase RimI-like enzyme
MCQSLPVHVREFEERDRAALIRLWTACGLTRPWNDPGRDIDRKLALDDHGLLVACDGDQLCGSVMAGYDGHRGWINYLAADPARRREGIGRRLVAEAEALLFGRGCPKINLQIRASNSEVVDFYRAVGYAEDDVLSMGKRLVYDEGHRGV